MHDCFNPRAREGRDPEQGDRKEGWFVSIHAPVKGATPVRPVILRGVRVSIHAPVKGAT